MGLEKTDPPLGDSSAQGSATNPWVSFTQKSWQPFPAPPATRSSALSQAPTLLLANCHCHPTYFKRHPSLNTHFPLWMCCVLSGFFFPSSPAPLEYNHFRAGSTHLFGTWPVLPRVVPAQSSSVNFTGIMPCPPVINSAPINHLGLCSGERNAQSCQNSECFKTSKRGQVLTRSKVLDVEFFTKFIFYQFSPGKFSSLHLEFKSLGQGELFIT